MPSMILQHFLLLVTLRLNVVQVTWSYLQKNRELVHLEQLHLCEHKSAPPLLDRAFARDKQMTMPPFQYLTSLTSLQLELYDNSSGSTNLDESSFYHGPLPESISCMTRLGSLTLQMQGSHCAWDAQHLSHLSHLTALGIDSLEQGISNLVKLEKFSVGRTYEPCTSHYMTPNLLASFTSLSMLTNLRSQCSGAVQWRQVPSMAVLTALTGLTMVKAYDMKHYAEDPICHVIWSGVSKLPLLISLDVVRHIWVWKTFRL